MRAGKVGLTIGLGAGALASAGYASAVGLARRAPAPVSSDEEIELILDHWLAELGVAGVHHYLPTPVGRVHSLELGSGPRTLIFLHGLGASVGEYAGLLAELSHSFHVVGIDRPGAGLSEPIRFDGHPRPAWNSVVAAVADSLELGRFDLVGHSLGGLAAGGFAVDHPDRLGRLVLLSPVGLAPNLPMLWSFSMVPGLTDLLTAAARLGMARQGRTDEDSAERGGPLRVGPQLARYRHSISARFPRGSDLESIPRLMRPFAFRPESLLLPGLGTLQGRVLVVWGDSDAQVALSPARDQLRGHPGLLLLVLPGAGHLFPFEDPVGTARRIEEWLDRADPLEGQRAL